MKNKKTDKKLNNKGFTLIELIVSISIVVILSGVVLNVSRFSDTHKSLTLARDEVRVAIRSAQTSSLSIPNPEKKHVCGYGVYIQTNKIYKIFYIYVSDSDFGNNPNSCRDETNYHSYTLVAGTQKEDLSTRTLGNDLEFEAANVGKGIFFRVPYSDVFGDDGQPLAADYVINIKNTNVGAQKSININTIGKIE